MKKIVAFFLALSMAVVMLAGCGASQTPTTTEAPKAETKAATEAAPAAETEQKELTIAGIVFKDEFTMKMVQQGYEDAAKDYGVNLVLGNSMGDLANEQQLVYSYIDMGVDGIAITPYSEEASIPILKEAYDKGIEVAVANIKLNDASFVCGGFTSQDLLNGQKLGDYTSKYLSDKYGNDLKIAIMDFDAAIPEQSKARYGGFLEKHGIRADSPVPELEKQIEEAYRSLDDRIVRLCGRQPYADNLFSAKKRQTDAREGDRKHAPHLPRLPPKQQSSGGMKPAF